MTLSISLILEAEDEKPIALITTAVLATGMLSSCSKKYHYDTDKVISLTTEYSVKTTVLTIMWERFSIVPGICVSAAADR